MGFPRQEYWSGFPFPSPGALLDPGIEPTSLEFAALAVRFFTASATWEALQQVNYKKKKKSKTLKRGKDLASSLFLNFLFIFIYLALPGFSWHAKSSLWPVKFFS